MSKFVSIDVVKLDGAYYQRLADGTLKPIEDRTNLAAVDATTEEEVNRQAEEDGTLLSDEEWAKVRFIQPGKQPVTIRLDSDVLAWFKAESERGYQTRINAVLRRYMAAHSKAS